MKFVKMVPVEIDSNDASLLEEAFNCSELKDILKYLIADKVASLRNTKDVSVPSIKPKSDGMGPDTSGLTYEDVFPTEDLPIALHGGVHYSELPDAKKVSVDAYVSRGVSNGVPVDTIRQNLVGDVVSSGPRTLNLPNGRIVPLKRSR
jgi:hypothetical protein